MGRGRRAARARLSAVLLHEGRFLGRDLPVLHHHPDPLRPFVVNGLPFEQVRYDAADTTIEVRDPARTSWQAVFRLPRQWPGPEDPFEGNTDTPMPAPMFWLPRNP